MEEELNQIPITTTQPPAAFPSLDSVISSSPASSASYSAHPMHPMPPKPLPFISDQDVVRNTAGTYAIFGSLYFLALAAVTAVSLSSQSLTRMEFTFLSHLWTTNYGLALPVAVQAGSITESGYLAIVLALCVIYSFMNLVEFGSRHNAAINKHATDKEIISWGAYAGSPAKGHVQHSLVFVGCIVQLLTLLSMQNSALREFYWCVFSMAVGCTAIYMVGYAYSCLHPHRGERTPSLTLVVTSWAMVLLGLLVYVGFTFYNVIVGANFVEVMTNYGETNVAVALGTVVCFLQVCFAFGVVMEIGSSPQQHVKETLHQVYLLIMIGFYCIVVYLRKDQA